MPSLPHISLLIWSHYSCCVTLVWTPLEIWICKDADAYRQPTFLGFGNMCLALCFLIFPRVLLVTSFGCLREAGCEEQATEIQASRHACSYRKGTGQIVRLNLQGSRIEARSAVLSPIRETGKCKLLVPSQFIHRLVCMQHFSGQIGHWTGYLFSGHFETALLLVLAVPNTRKKNPKCGFSAS